MDAFEQGHPLPGSQWIATGLRLPDDKGEGMYGIDHNYLSLRGKNEVKDAAIHCMQWTCSEKAVCFPTPSGSPRAYALAMTRYENGTLGCEFTPGLRVPGMALLGYRPFGPSPSRSAFLFRHVRRPSVHCSVTIAFGNQHGSR